MKEYFVIHVNDDGEISITPYNKENLLKAIEEKHYADVEFREKLDEENPQYWRTKNTLIIKGKIIIPKPKEVVKTYELE